MSYTTMLIHSIFVILAVMGVALSNRKKRACYILWIITNTAWGIINWQAGLRVEALQNGVFLYLALEGLVKWKNEEWL